MEARTIFLTGLLPVLIATPRKERTRRHTIQNLTRWHRYSIHDAWEEHFEVQGPLITGRTAKGRATVQLLGMNDNERVEMRAELLDSQQEPS
jgi:hypothetical protein